MVIIVINVLVAEFKKQFTCLGENTEKYITFLLIAQDFWQAHYQILSIIFLKKFIELNENTDMIKNVRPVKLNISITTTVFLNIQTLKMI